MNYSDSSRAVHEFENKTANVLKDAYQRYDSDGTIFLAAVSGGADSMAMLSALSVLIPKERLFCLHVEHSLRPEIESRGDAEFVRDFCEKNGINFILKIIAPGKIASFSKRRGSGIEASARFFRRKALLREAGRLGNNTIILTAHTKNDALELTLMRVLRGAGPSGIAAMPVKKGRFFRPLLSMTRADVSDYLTEKKISWREDSTNTNEKFLRNKVRRRLVPFLDEFFPFWEKGLAGMSETQIFTAEFIGNEAKNRISWVQENNNFITDSKNFFSQPLIIREEAVFSEIDHLLLDKNPVPIKRSVVRRFCTGKVKAADLACFRCGTLRIKLENGKILLCPAVNNSSETGFSLLINKPGLYNLNRVGIKVLPYSPDQEDLKYGCGFFYTGLPLVFRRSFNDDFLVSGGKKIGRQGLCKNLISAIDINGTAAFINKTEVLFTRDFASEECDETVYLVKLFPN